MKIGLRTIKTAVGCMVAMLAAKWLGLDYWASAGIITILSVQNTTKSSFRLVFFRILSTVVAFTLAVVSFELFGFNAVAFGIFLLFFIPITTKLRLQDGIVVSAVLVSQFMMEKSVAWPLLFNAFYLMLIGAGIAVVLNLFMPNLEEQIATYQEQVEHYMRLTLKGLATQLATETSPNETWETLSNLKESLARGANWTLQHNENQLLSENDYYRAYFEMRNNQYAILREMQEAILDMKEPIAQGLIISDLLDKTATQLSENNPAVDLMKQLKDVEEDFANSELPQTRDSFEARARLYLFLKDFEHLLILKANFYQVVKAQEIGEKAFKIK